MSGDTNTHHNPFTLQSGNGLKTEHFKNTKNKARQKYASQHLLILTICQCSLPLCASNLLSLFLVLPSPPPPITSSLHFHFIVPLSSWYKTLCLQPIPVSFRYTSLSYFTCQSLLISSALTGFTYCMLLTQLLIMTWHGCVLKVSVCL